MNIMNHLQEQLNYAITTLNLNTNNILGIFLYGSQNYNMATENSDIDSKVILLPTYDDLYERMTPFSKELHFGDNEHIEVKDIRLFKDLFLKQNINFLEILFTEYYIINQKYEPQWAYLRSNRETISHTDPVKAYYSISGQIYHTLKQYKDDNDYKKLYNAYRLTIFLKTYFSGATYKKCMQLEGAEYEFAYGIKTQTVYYQPQEILDFIYSELEALQEYAKPNFFHISLEDGDRVLRRGITSILRKHLKDL